MKFPYLENIPQTREMTTSFQGYSHLLSCREGSFFDMKNITTEHYPILSPRQRRGFIKTLENPQGLIDKDGLVWVEDGVLYIDNEAVTMTDVTLSDEGEKQIEKMGAYIVIMPDKVWYNTKDNTYGYIENSVELSNSVSFSICGADGTAITVHPSSYYKPDGSVSPTTGAYKVDTQNGKTVLSVYSAVTGLWASVPSVYMKISESGIGAGFEKGDGVKVTVNLTGISWDYASNIFVNDEGDGKRSNNFTVYDVGANYITVPAILNENKTITAAITVERKCPTMAFITECQNRIWGCSEDGHEIYCCKLGDVKNWNSFAGISTDSYTATIGSDGVFTGAITYLGNPIFFKEDSIIRVSVSAIGAHSVKESKARGVQLGSHKSLVQLNEVLIYKSATAVCVYDGSFPSEVSANLGVGRYYDAVGGSINNRYYISMRDSDGWNIFVYDIQSGLWAKEDSVQVLFFATEGNELYFIRSDGKFCSVYGTLPYGSTEMEKPLDWMAESGEIGFATADKKYVSRINIRMSLDVESHVSFYLQYDSDGKWIHQFNMSGKGTQTFTLPVRPQRCDHYKYRLVGHGDAKIISITKSYEEGSDI